jgi:UDPglucose 6-dehydrogenase
LAEKTGQAVIFDGRNLYDPWRMAAAGFEYHSIGRPHVAAVTEASEQQPVQQPVVEG